MDQLTDQDSVEREMRLLVGDEDDDSANVGPPADQRFASHGLNQSVKP
jgi:hypothetical protein